MGLRSFVEDVLRVIRVTRKPTRSEYWLLLRISIIGLTVLGLYGFLVLYLARVIAAAVGAGT